MHSAKIKYGDGSGYKRLGDAPKIGSQWQGYTHSLHPVSQAFS